jgi:hypothetical protein
MSSDGCAMYTHILGIYHNNALRWTIKPQPRSDAAYRLQHIYEGLHPQAVTTDRKRRAASDKYRHHKGLFTNLSLPPRAGVFDGYPTASVEQ